MSNIDSVIYRAGWILADSQTLVQDGYVSVSSGIIEHIGKGRLPTDRKCIDCGSGVLMPALVNAHTHLELSFLRNRLSRERGFRPWVQQLLALRDAAAPETLIKGAETAIREIQTAGTGMVGEISTLGVTRRLFEQAELMGVWFQEFLGTELPAADAAAEAIGTDSKAVSLAGHAPHTTSPDLLAELKNRTRRQQLPFSIHLAESEDETEFLETGKGLWADFLTQRGIDFSGWGLPVSSPVRYMDRIGVLDRLTLVVHLIRAGREDFRILADRECSVCLCPRSNYHLHQKLPDVSSMLTAGIAPCLGTDSLASTDSLSLWDEMAFLARRFPGIAPERILEMATLNGARALGYDNRYGTLAPGKSAHMIHVPVDGVRPADIPDALVHADFNKDNMDCIVSNRPAGYMHKK